MSVSAIWLDQEQANIFRFSDGKMEINHLKSMHQDHPTHRLDHLDQKRQESVFFAEAVACLTEATRVLILGPGNTKDHFHKYVTEHHADLGNKIGACETVDHPSDPQIAAHARSFFKL